MVMVGASPVGPFRKNEMLNIIEKHEEQWWRAQGQESLRIGVVPANYVDECVEEKKKIVDGFCFVFCCCFCLVIGLPPSRSLPPHSLTRVCVCRIAWGPAAPPSVRATPPAPKALQRQNSVNDGPPPPPLPKGPSPDL
jgi:hypothetical protein